MDSMDVNIMTADQNIMNPILPIPGQNKKKMPTFERFGG
jgi:hypothetical protein